MANFHFLLFLCLVLLISIAAATQFKVGGSKGWTLPSDPKEYTKWAERHRFRIGDSLLFVYAPDKDSVLLVDENSYHSCNTTSFIDNFDDGNTVFVFTRSGPYYFISGDRDNCQKNETLVAVVMADRSNGTSLAPPPPPPPPPNGASSKVVGLMGSIGACIGSLFFVL